MNRPNIVTIMSDDQGYGDLSCMGNTDFRTPHLDRLATSGARCTDFYSNSPVCSPSRASLLTGHYPGNAGVRSILKGYRTTPGLSTAVPTSARLLKDQGYRTGLIGKWHLGMAAGSRPSDHGFDTSFGFRSGAVDYFSHIHYGPNNRQIPHGDGFIEGTPLHDLWEDDEETWQDGHYFTELVTERAVSFIRDEAASADPFYLHVAYSAPHFPMHAPQKYRDRFAHLPWDRQIMAAMISAMDDGVGSILDELERQGMSENTVVFFMSDNGPSREIRNWLDGRQDTYYGGTTGKLKGHKFSLFDGGVRVPAIVAWPGTIPAGQVIDQPLIAMDMLPTFLSWAGADVNDLEFDGADVSAVFSEHALLAERDLHWEQGGQTAIRRGRWKLVLNGQLVEDEGPVAEVFLSDLETDPGERDNLADAHPELTAELIAAARGWREGIEETWSTRWLPTMPDHDANVHPGFIR